VCNQVSRVRVGLGLVLVLFISVSVTPTTLPIIFFTCVGLYAVGIQVLRINSSCVPIFVSRDFSLNADSK